MNVCIYRIPKGESIVFPPSSCPACKKKIKSYDLIPIVSYLILKGKCRNCKSKIPASYPLIELLTGIIFVIIYLNFGLTLKMFLYAFLVCILIVASIIDFKTKYVYFNLSLLGFISGAIFLINNYINGEEIKSYILGGFIAGGIILIFALLGVMGFGDIEIAFICGLFVGGPLAIVMNILAIVFAGIAGSIILIINKIRRKEEKTMPFVPFISVGCFVTLIFGEVLVNGFLDYYVFY